MVWVYLMSCSNITEKSIESILDRKILIVDDEETNVRLLEYLLRRKGYRSIYGVTDPRTVIPIYQELCPDLVLLDLVMPHINGIELMEKLQNVERETYPSVVVISASENDEPRIRSLALGAIDFLPKPFNRTEVVVRVTNMLRVQPVLQPRKFSQKDKDLFRA